MRKLTICLLAITISLAVTTSAIAAPVRQLDEGFYGSCDAGSFELFIDFTLTDGDWDVVNNWYGEYVAGVGWRETVRSAGYDIIVGENYTSLFSPDWDDLVMGDSWILYSNSEDTLHQYNYYTAANKDWFGWQDVIENGWNYLWHDPTGYDDIYVRVEVGWYSAGATPGVITGYLINGTNTGDCPADFALLPPIPTWVEGRYKPAQEAETLEINAIANLDDLITTTLYANVYASLTGTVTHTSVSSAGYWITITADDGYYAVYNNLYSVYPKPGDAITAGCVIGIAGPKVANTVATYTEPVSQFFYIVRDETDTELDWSDWIDPFGSRPCGVISGNCVNANPNIDGSASGWEQDDSFLNESSITTQAGSITLDWSDSISQTVVLNPSTNWYATIVATQTDTSHHGYYTRYVEVTLGDDTIDQSYGPVTALEEYLIEVGPLNPTAPDYAPDLYDFEIRNNDPASNGLRITFACLHQQDAISITPDYCYFDNYAFSNDTEGDGWDYDAGADWRNSGIPGSDYRVELDAGEWISQAVTLTSYTAADAVYKLTVGARVGGNTLGDIVDLFVEGWETTFAQEVYDGVTLELDIGDKTINNVVIYQSPVTEFTVTTASSPLEGDLTITADAGNTKSLSIDYVCIEPLTGLWPGQEDDDLTLARPVCSGCSAPESINLVEWLAYLSCNISELFYCVLARWINDLAQQVYGITSMIGYLGRWFSASLYSFGAWLLALISGLSDLIMDILLGSLAALWNWIAALPMFVALYDLLSLIWQMFTSGGTLLGLLSDLMVNVFGMITTFAAIVGGFKDALFAAINSTTIVTTEMPTCLDTMSPLYGICIGLDIVQAVMTEFPTTAASLYLVAGVAGIITIVWTVKQIGQAAGDVQ